MNNKKNKNNRQGFTLIELLVVISIIGILSSFAVVSLNSARVKARDALRKGDMAQIRTALGLYYMENNHYPICGTWVEDAAQDYGATTGDNVGDGSWCYLNGLGADLTVGPRPIIEKMPLDPQNNDNKAATSNIYIYRYVSDATGAQYAFYYNLEEGGEQSFRGW